MHKVVLDTIVFVSALISRQGASFKLLTLLGEGRFDISLSVALVLEYEDTAKRLVGSKITLSEEDIDNIIDYLCLISEHHKVYFLWRPVLSDPKDDMVLELAVNSGCSFIVTYNVADFRGIELFDLEVITPKTFLEKLGALS